MSNPEERIHIYMIQRKEYDRVLGLWTDLDEMLAWVSRQTYSWTEATGETDLDVFMNRNWVVEYQDGGGHGKSLPWEEIIPQD